MAGAAISLGGVGQRLLPEEIPARFFATAILAHVLMWGGLIWMADEIPSYQGGGGPVLTVVHLLTAGVLLPTAMGASLQMLPVALGRASPAVAACHAVFGFLLLGLLILLLGFTTRSGTAIQVAAILLSISVIIHGATIIRMIAGGAGLSAVEGCVLLALAFLTTALLLAAMLATNYRYQVLTDPGVAAMAHALLAIYGFMGLLALGFSQFLIPMFAVAEPGSDTDQVVALTLSVVSLSMAITGVLAKLPWLCLSGVVGGAFAATFHVRGMRRIIGTRLRKRLGSEFYLIKFSWMMLAASLVIGGLLAVDALPARGAAVFIFVVLAGWLLSLLTGILQRVLPFLASMHAFRGGARPLAPAKLVLERPLWLHRYCHSGAVIIVSVGIIADLPLVIRGGAVVGGIGAMAFACFAATVWGRFRGHLAMALAKRTTDDR